MMDDASFQVLRLARQGYSCSQILVMLAMELQDRTNPDLVRAMAGLGHGLGHSGEVCGVLTGGCCLIALYTGKGSGEESEDERFMLMVSELVEWFRETVGGRRGGIRCCDILGEGHAGAPDLSGCGDMVLETYGKVMEILTENGIDPTTGKSE
jgi:C_GCAxxG_C_C family probable redox protein